MGRSRAFCPRCGASTATRPRRTDGGAWAPSVTKRGLCDRCYLDEFDLVDVPDRLTIRVCSRCGAVHRGNRWVHVGADDYTEVAIDAVGEAVGVHRAAEDLAWGVEPEQVDRNTLRMHLRFSGVVRGRPVEADRTVPVTIARETCTRCGRIAGDYYASTVQVRAHDRSPTDAERSRAAEIAHEVVAEMEATGDREAFVAEIADADGGLDIKVSTTRIGEKIARRLVGEFGGRYADSETLVTEDEDGNEVYRVAYAVRLPPFRPGEVIAPDDAGPVLVRSVRGNLKGVRLTTGEPYEARFEEGDAPEARRLGWRADAEETALVAVEDEHAVQVLDPETYETETVARPDYLDPDAETVPVLRSRAGLHVLPEADDAEK